MVVTWLIVAFLCSEPKHFPPGISNQEDWPNIGTDEISENWPLTLCTYVSCNPEVWWVSGLEGLWGMEYSVPIMMIHKSVWSKNKRVTFKEWGWHAVCVQPSLNVCITFLYHILFQMYVSNFIYVWIVLNVCNCTHERTNTISCILYLDQDLRAKQTWGQLYIFRVRSTIESMSIKQSVQAGYGVGGD